MKGQFPWIGRSRGSAGGMTTAKINDKNVMRAKAFDVTNPKTAAQVMQRNFFKEVQEVCASVTEDQLRSLFGIKPKTMTRRNALSKQIAAAFTITEGVKSVDFSKLLAIGNDEKVFCPIATLVDGRTTNEFAFTEEMFPGMISTETNAILVFFNSNDNKIEIVNTPDVILDDVSTSVMFEEYFQNKTGWGYVTTSKDCKNVSELSFGSFIIKTRATD